MAVVTAQSDLPRAHTRAEQAAVCKRQHLWLCCHTFQLTRPAVAPVVPAPAPPPSWRSDTQISPASLVPVRVVSGTRVSRLPSSNTCSERQGGQRSTWSWETCLAMQLYQGQQCMAPTWRIEMLPSPMCASLSRRL